MLRPLIPRPRLQQDGKGKVHTVNLLLFLMLGCCFACFSQRAAFAHRMNTAMSLIEVSPTTGKLEVSHTLFAHDMEGVLAAGAVDMNWLETARGEAAIKTYCLRQFTITDGRGRPLRLAFVGVELRGDIIQVYFEAPRYVGRDVIVDSNFLQELSDSQINRVNVRANGRTNSAVFEAGAVARRIAIPTR
jgi:hypothetical protein